MYQGVSKTESYEAGADRDTPAAGATAAIMRSRPRIAPDLEITRGDDRGSYYVVQDPRTGKYLRLHAGAVAILCAFDGNHTVADVAAKIDGACPEQIWAVISKLADYNLIIADPMHAAGVDHGGDGAGAIAADSTVSVESQRKRRRSGLLSVPLAHWNADSWLETHRERLRVMVGWPGRIGGGLLILAGVAAALLSLDRLQVALSELPRGLSLVWLLTALIFVMVLHEFAHAITLKAYGGRVSQIGVMLLYLTPALFCNTSDTWRLQAKRHRVAVVSAGIFFQLVVAAAAVLVFWLMPGSPTTGTGRMVAWFAAMNAALGVSNLVPFLKQDGYWMLALTLDKPNLRTEALGWLKALVLRGIYGEPLQEPGPARPICLAIFGTLYILFVTFVVVAILVLYQPLLLNLGALGALIWLALVAGVAGYPLWSASRGAMRRLREDRRGSIRASILVGSSVVCMLLLFSAPLVPMKMPVAYEKTTDRDRGEIRMSAEAAHLVTQGDLLSVSGRFQTVRAKIVEQPRPNSTKLGKPVEVPISAVDSQNADRSLPDSDQTITADFGNTSALGWLDTNFARPIQITLARA